MLKKQLDKLLHKYINNYNNYKHNKLNKIIYKYKI